MGNGNFKTLSIDEFLEITMLPDFPERIKKEHEQLVEAKIPGTIKHFSKPKNTSKNRSNFLPCWDHSRVILKPPSKGIPYIHEIVSDYIHANFVDGFEDEMKFICTQSPKENTCEDFWRMVFQENCHIIVSLTELDNPLYCYEYWAKEKYCQKVFGRYVIRTLEIIEEETYTRTELRLIDANSNESWDIHHFLYTDFSLGSGWVVISLELLDLILQVNQKQEELMKIAGLGPIVVHCSGGLDWTGIFCTLDNALYQVRKEQTVSLPLTVLNIRQQRHSSCQFLIEYEICYRVLSEAIKYMDSYIKYNHCERLCVFETDAAINYFLGIPDSK